MREREYKREREKYRGETEEEREVGLIVPKPEYLCGHFFPDFCFYSAFLEHRPRAELLLLAELLLFPIQSARSLLAVGQNMQFAYKASVEIDSFANFRMKNHCRK